MDDVERWLRLQDLFERAALLAPQARAAFLESEESDPTLRADVMALLRADGGDDVLDDLVERVASGQVRLPPLRS